MNTLTLDLKDPVMMEAVKQCKVGDDHTFTVKGTVESVDGEFVMNVASVEYVEAEEVEDAEEVVDEEEKPMTYAKDKNPALMVLIGKKSK